jgi:NADH-quinone oxidoreductase subunit L
VDADWEACRIDVAFQVDQLSMVMMMIITGIGTLIHIFSVGYMQEDPGYPRYFAYLNLFVFFMLLLVLGSSYPLMFVGWEGVGLCSYLLIGFWFSEKANADAGKKAFIVNRIGDFGFLVAMFLIFANFGSLTTPGSGGRLRLPLAGRWSRRSASSCSSGARASRADPALRLAARRHGGPDAGLGAHPRGDDGDRGRVPHRPQRDPLLAGAGGAAHGRGSIGALTALFAATIGLKQWDIKKVLAYSTVSQLGYMFVGVGVGAYTAGSSTSSRTPSSRRSCSSGRAR